MKNKGFVFSGMAFLLIIPTVILAASLLNMVQYGERGVELTIASDEVFYSCNNLLAFLEEGARDGNRARALQEASIYAGKKGINFSYSIIAGSQTNYTLVVQSADGTVCNKTSELKLGSLIANLTLLRSYAYSGSVPVYLRNMTIPFTVFVTYNNGSAVNGASVLVDLLGVNRSGYTNSTGYYYNSTVYIPNTTSHPSAFNSPYVNSRNGCPDCDKCYRKEPLGSRIATANASLSNWYDGTDEEQFYIYGNITGSVITEKSGSKLDVWVTLSDIYTDPITLDCNYTSYPTITMRVDEEQSGTVRASYYYSINGSGTSCTQAAPCELDESGTETGIYHIASSTARVAYSSNRDYYAYVNASRTDYYPYTSGRVAANVYAAEFTNNVTYDTSICPGSKYSIWINAINNGTTDLSNISIALQYNTGTGWVTYGTYSKSSCGACILKARGTTETIRPDAAGCSTTIPEFGDARLFANITVISPRNDASTNTYSCGAYGAGVGIATCPP